MPGFPQLSAGKKSFAGLALEDFSVGRSGTLQSAVGEELVIRCRRLQVWPFRK